ncbi:MAG: LCP family protein [[Clostridium] cellulosi]
MKHQGALKRGILIFVIAATFITVAAAAGTAALKNWRPLKEKGSAPETASKTSSTEDFSNFLLCGIDNTNSLTDVIMVANFDSKNHKLTLLQIPRDTYVSGDVPSHKYNAVYSHHDKNVSGMETLKAQIENDFGITIDHYAAVTTKGFRKIVDAVGGVDIDVPINMNYDDDEQDLHIHLKKGLQHLNGAKAEQFVRYRKGWSQGDLGRLNAQRIFLAALMQKIKSMSAWEIGTKIVPVVSAPNFLTDLSGYQMLEFYNLAKDINLSDAAVYTMPGEPFSLDGVDYYSVHKDELLEILNAHFVPEGTELSIYDLKIVQMADSVKTDNNADDFENILSGNR